MFSLIRLEVGRGGVAPAATVSAAVPATVTSTTGKYESSQRPVVRIMDIKERDAQMERTLQVPQMLPSSKVLMQVSEKMERPTVANIPTRADEEVGDYYVHATWDIPEELTDKVYIFGFYTWNDEGTYASWGQRNEDGTGMSNLFGIQENGTYNVMLNGWYELDEENWGTFLIHRYVDIEGADVDIVLNLADLKNKYRYNPMLPDGNPFPVAESDEEEVTSSLFYFTNFAYFTLMSWVSGSSALTLWTNDIPEGVSWSCLMEYNDIMAGQGNALYGSFDSPFTESAVWENDPQYYLPYEAKFSLTESAKAFDQRSMGFNIMNLFVDTFNGMGGMSARFNSEPQDHFTINYCTPPGHVDREGLWESGISLSMLGALDPEWDENNTLRSGYFIKLEDSSLRIVNGSYHFSDEQDHFTLLSNLDCYNINPAEQEIVNMYYPLYGSPYFDIWVDEDKNIVDFGIAYSLFGMLHETLELVNPFNCFKEIKYNGTAMEPEELFGNPVEDAMFEVTYEYDDMLVADTFTTKASSVLGLNTKGDDLSVPSMTGYMLHNSEGKITNVFKPGEEATLWVSGADMDYVEGSMVVNENMTMKVEIAPMGMDFWTTINEAPTLVGRPEGFVVEVPLSHYGCWNDQWYRLQVTLTDDAGNYIVNTIPYCFIFTNGTGVEQVAVSTVEGAEYFDLQGRRVSNPEPGLYIVRQGDKVWKELRK